MDENSKVDSANADAFVVAGMHRSGTSLASSILQAGGVRMIEKFVPGDFGNSRGYFEDDVFLEFHRELLRAQGHPHEGWVCEGDLTVPEDAATRARELIQNAAAFSGPAGWGWKDPRTTLFLEFWLALLPGARFVLLYRAPWEVADSIFRRASEADQFFHANPSDVVRVWRFYNERVLDFVARHAPRCAVVSNDAMMADPAGFVRVLNERFGAAVAPPPADIVDSQMMDRRATQSTRPQLVAEVFPESLEVLRRLQSVSIMPSIELENLPSARGAEEKVLQDAFRDWFDRHQLARDKDQMDRQYQRTLQWYQQKVMSLEEQLRAEWAKQKEAADQKNGGAGRVLRLGWWRRLVALATHSNTGRNRGH